MRRTDTFVPSRGVWAFGRLAGGRGAARERSGAPCVEADLARTLQRRTAPAVFAMLLTVMAAAGLLLETFADRQDKAAVDGTTALVAALLGERAQLMRRVVTDYAAWGEAYRNLHERLSVDWAYNRSQLADTLRTTFGFEMVLVIRPDGAVGYALADGELLAADPRSRLSGGLGALVEAARAAAPPDGRSTAPVVGNLLLDGRPAIVGAGAVVPAESPAASYDPTAPTVLVFVDRLSEAELVRRGEGGLVAGLRFALPDARGVGLPFVGFDGTPLARVTWERALPGSELKAALLPWLAGCAAAVLALAAMALRDALFAARALAASEIRFRDVSDAASDWIWETDAELRLVFLSERFAEMTGFDLEEALGQPLGRYLELESPAEAHSLEALLRGRPPGAVGHFQCAYRTRHAARRVGRVSARPVLDADGRRVGYRGTVSDVTPEVEAQREAREAALHDPLTGLPNRILLLDRLRQGLRQVERHGGGLAVLCVDLDRFKPVNDTFGHGAGDLVLREVARRLQAHLREGDTVARVGGDEFVVLAQDPEGRLELESLCRRLLAAGAQPIAVGAERAEVGLSIGVARFPADAADLDRLLSHADLALYEAKRAGRGTHRFFTPALSQRQTDRRTLEQELRRAVERQEFALEFQPRFQLPEMNLVAAEALLRWRHPSRGSLAPSSFLEIAEETGLMLPIGEWALREACRRAATLRGLRISVNLSRAEFRRDDLAAHLGRVLVWTGLPAGRLELEIPEGALAQEGIDAAAAMAALKELGVGLVLDDFGSGASSLSSLRRFPFDRLKIDRRFVADLEANVGTRAIVRSVIGLGRALGLAVTVEGVETDAQLRILRAEGCDEVQGFYIGRPVSWEGIERSLGAAAPDATEAA